MNQLMTMGQQAVTMSSLELVDFINSQRAEDEAELRHDHFMVKVAKVLGEASPKFLGTDFYVNGTGAQVERRVYRFPKREACLMAMSYSYELQAKVFDRMTELEAQQSNHIRMPNFANPAEAARAWAEEFERKQIAEAQRDEAVRTKALIGSKREATAMATASAAKREADQLRHELGFSARHATILQVEDATGGDYDFVLLRRWCKANEVTPEVVPDKRYPKGVKAWPAGAWLAVYSIDLAALFPVKEVA